MTGVRTDRSIPFFNYRQAFVTDEAAYVEIFRDVLRRGAFIQQRDLASFEKHLASYLGVRFAMGVGNCTDGLIMSFRALDLRPGDEVIFPSHTMVASAASVFFAGGRPVPVECGADHLIDPDAVEAAVSRRTRAIVPVHLNGRTCDMRAIMAIAERYDLAVVEDAAQALGSRFRDGFAGTFGRAAAFSFYPAKILGCFGDGGAVVTDDPDIARAVGLLRDHGRNDDGDVERWGLNSRLDNLQAAILDFQLKGYDRIIAKRRDLARRYRAGLESVEAVTLPPGPDGDVDHFDVYQNYEIEAERRDELRAHLQRAGVGTIVQWGGKAVHQFGGLGFDVRLPQTEQLFTRLLLLPMNTTLSDDDVDYITLKIREFYGA